MSPSRGEFAALAEGVQAKIRELSGAELPILDVEAATPERLAGSHAILLGNVDDNRAMAPLYAHLYTPVDAAYPADDGYLVHTVHNPWGTGKNAVVLGGSTAAGTGKGVGAFLDTLAPGPDLVLPKLNLFSLGEDEMKTIRKRAETLDDDQIQREVEAAKRDFARGTTVRWPAGWAGTASSIPVAATPCWPRCTRSLPWRGTRVIGNSPTRTAALGGWTWTST